MWESAGFGQFASCDEWFPEENQDFFFEVTLTGTMSDDLNFLEDFFAYRMNYSA
jgi:hypothetical protein